jgi:hypothetical protein
MSNRWRVGKSGRVPGNDDLAGETVISEPTGRILVLVLVLPPSSPRRRPP